MPLLIRRCLPLILTAIIALLHASAARAESPEVAERSPDVPDGSAWGVGIGASLKRSPYRGISSDNNYIPLAYYESRYVRLFGNVFDVKLPSEGPLDFSLRAKVSPGEGYKASKSVYLTGMESRKGSIYLGAATTFHTGAASLSLDYLKDVSGNSKGSQLKLGVDRPFSFERRYQVTPHASVTRLDAKYVDYYYGVSEAEVTPARPAYAGKSTTNAEIGVRIGYLVAPDQRLLLDVTDEHWGSGISKSPLVDRASTPGLLIGYIYTF